MKQVHLDTASLLALYRGDVGNFAALEHLATCAECQRVFDDSRWLWLLRWLPELVKEGPHPTADELVAYRNHALSSPRIADVEDHLRSCTHCLTRYRRGRKAEQTRAYSTPPQKTFKVVQSRFRPRALRQLGTVLLTGKRRLLLLLLPERIAAAGELGFTETRRRHPASATRRVQLLSKRVARPIARESFDMKSVEDGEALFGTASPRARTDVRAAEELRIPADGWELVLSSTSDSDKPGIAVQLIARDEKKKASAIRVRVRGPQRSEAETLTDDGGRARLALAPGRSVVTIEVDPPLSLRLELPD